MKISHDDITAVLTYILASEKETKSDAYAAVLQNESVKQALDCAAKGDYKSFYFGFEYPIKKAMDGLLEKFVTAVPEAMFILRQSPFVEHQFRAVIETCEGMSCCSDKTRTLMRALLKFYMTGEKIAFDRNQKYTFHLPQKVFCHHDDIIGFFNGVLNLYHGRPEAFLVAREKQLVLAQAVPTDNTLSL
jgi:hypothetical protein